MSAEENAARIRSAASLLLKGGTLMKEPCARCGGVQVQFADKAACINCGNEERVTREKKIEDAEGEGKIAVAHPPAIETANLALAASIIEEKITILAKEIRIESDSFVQKQKLDLLESYLTILEKIKNMIG
jgi:uncharacterized Zn finger protein (UPF0148 family)